MPTPLPQTRSAGGGEPEGDENGAGAKSAQQQQPKYHVDMQVVHVDLTIGTDSVISDGQLHAGQQVVTDGAEKLVDGSNVAPAQSRGGKSSATNPGSVNSGVGAGAASTGSNAQPNGSSTQSSGSSHQ